MDKNKMMIAGGGLLILLIIIYVFFFRKKGGKTSDGGSGGDEGTAPPTIYGSLGCPYTVKQMEKYPKHTFVDCSSGGCPSFVTAYPTTKWPDGKMEVGFS